MEHDRLCEKAAYIRRQALKLVYTAKTGHIGGTLSSVDYLVSLYYHIMNINVQAPDDPDRDRFILSKGHCVEGYYSILADLGFFPEEELRTFSQYATRLIGHPNREVPGVEMNTGALGHGLSAACGMALAAKLDTKSYRVFTLLGDGELAEGSNWEAAMFASHYKLDNLYAAVDRNHLQITGPTEEVLSLEPLKEKWESFGFCTLVVNGNDIGAILDAFQKLESVTNKPKMLLLDTIKGKGVPFMENVTRWHHGSLTEEQYQTAIQHLTSFDREVKP